MWMGKRGGLKRFWESRVGRICKLYVFGGKLKGRRFRFLVWVMECIFIVADRGGWRWVVSFGGDSGGKEFDSYWDVCGRGV